MAINIISRIVVICLVGLPMTSQARSIKSITIQAVGQFLDEGKGVDAATECEKFKPTANQIERFFTRAFPATDYLRSEKRYTPCYAMGKMTFGDNISADWILYSSGVAQLLFSQEYKILLCYKKNAWFDPTANTYEMSTNEKDDPC